MRFLPIAVTGLLLLAGNVSAHIDLSAAPAETSAQPGTPLLVTATAKELCPEAAVLENAQGVMELTANATSPAGYFTAQPVTLPWDAAACETSGDDAGYLVSSGDIEVAISPLAPAGPLQIVTGLVGTDTTTTTNVTVLQYANLAGQATTSASRHDHHDVGPGMAMFGIDIPVTVQSNGALTLSFTLDGQDAPQDIQLANPLLDGSNETTVDVPVTVLVGDGELQDYELVIEALDDNGTALATHSIVFAADNTQATMADPCAEADDHGDHDHGDHDETMETMQADEHNDCDEELNEDSPGVPLLALIAGLVVVALRRHS